MVLHLHAADEPAEHEAPSAMFPVMDGTGRHVIRYLNHRGETKEYRISVVTFEFRALPPYYPKRQLLMCAIDVDRAVERWFSTAPDRLLDMREEQEVTGAPS